LLAALAGRNRIEGIAMSDTLLNAVEAQVVAILEWLRLVAEGMSGLVIAIGLALMVARVAQGMWRGHGSGLTAIRLGFARYLVLALELQIAADILSTAIAPSWEQLGKLALVALIRALLGYFLLLELREGPRTEKKP